MAPYIPAARRRPRFSTASPDSVPPPAAMLVMIASSSRYAMQAPIILRQHVALVNAATGTIGRRETRLRATPDLRAGQVIRIQRSRCGRTAGGGRHAGRQGRRGGVDASAFTGGR